MNVLRPVFGNKQNHRAFLTRWLNRGPGGPGALAETDQLTRKPNREPARAPVSPGIVFSSRWRANTVFGFEPRWRRIKRAKSFIMRSNKQSHRKTVGSHRAPSHAGWSGVARSMLESYRMRVGDEAENAKRTLGKATSVGLATAFGQKKRPRHSGRGQVDVRQVARKRVAFAFMSV